MPDDPKLVRDEVAEQYSEYVFPAIATYYDDPLVVNRGEGAKLYDVDGTKYLDFFGGILTVQVGHANPKVVSRVCEQFREFSHCSTLYQIPAMAKLAERLADITPGKLKKSFFTNSGSEANETAVAAARAATGHQELIALRHSYHGRSQLAQTLTGISSWRTTYSHLPDIRHALSPYCYRCPLGLEYPGCDLACADDVEELIKTTTMGRVAGIIAEPIQGVGGFITPPPEYHKRVAEIVREYGGVFVADEVQTGFGRTGTHWFGIEHWDVEPDIITCAKGMANGTPIGATIATDEVADCYPKPTISTFGGNPVSMTASLATIDVIEEEDLLPRVTSLGAKLREGLEDIADDTTIIGEVRGKGFMVGVEVVRPGKEPAADLTTAVLAEARQRGLLVGRGGTAGNVLRVTPPLNVAEAKLETALEILAETFHTVQQSNNCH